MTTIKIFLLLLLLPPTVIFADSVAAPAPAPDNIFEKPGSLEKYTYIHLYVQIINPTQPLVVRGPNNNPLGFGNMIMVDNPLTEGIDSSSKLIGREQGYTIGISRDPDFSTTINFLTLNLAFTDGEHNGSTITVMGRDPVFNAQRELMVVGGTGAFRMARGYSFWTINSFNITGNSVVEGDIHVFHY
ncbi:hypothetical protein KSP40_PGU022383 [Platanthera guangdongensis]|uniref:Dirigent protein n=1 Tax=Platanthera guangdongensis TaxID=2320717 RepID=A0ABR2MST9_9ASPA